MKAFNSIALLCLTIFSHCSHAADLTISIMDARSDEGVLLIAVVNDEAAFLKDGMRPFASLVLTPRNKSVAFVLKDIPEGSYALSVFQDVNGNGKLDSNMLGIPNEPYGFSNNAMGNFGPPKFPAAAVLVGDTDVSTTINLN